MDKDILFLLEKDFTDSGNGPFFCPESALIEGMLTYYPQLRERLDIRYVGFTKPRSLIVELLDESNQGCPLLILADETNPPSESQTVNGRTFIAGVRPIARHLAARHGIGLIHGDNACSLSAESGA